MRSLFACIVTLVFSFISIGLRAQAPEMADQMRSDGKIYVVVSIIMVVVLGLIIYMFVIDRKVSRLERNDDKGSQ